MSPVRANGTSAGVLAGGLTGAIVLICIIIALLLMIRRQRSNRLAEYDDNSAKVDPYDYHPSNRSSAFSIADIPIALQSVNPPSTEDLTKEQIIQQHNTHEATENQPRHLQEIRATFGLLRSEKHVTSLDPPPQYSNSIATLRL